MIVVTGATGSLGKHVIAGLLDKVPADQVAVVVRNPEKADAYAERGVEVRVADYSAPETLKRAFRAGEKVLLISSSEVGQRAPQHRAVIDAAKEAGVALLAYTSMLGGSEGGLLLSGEHADTEQYLADSGVAYVLLRNGWYFENFTELLGGAIAAGGILTSAGEGATVFAASRADYAAAAVAVLTGVGHENRVYELIGDGAWSLEEYAAEVSKQFGRETPVNRVSTEAHQEILTGFGLPKEAAVAVADIDSTFTRNFVPADKGDFTRLIGRPTTALAEAVTAGLKNLQS